jgi:hypothetical protein
MIDGLSCMQEPFAPGSSSARLSKMTGLIGARRLRAGVIGEAQTLDGAVVDTTRAPGRFASAICNRDQAETIFAEYVEARLGGCTWAFTR